MTAARDDVFGELHATVRKLAAACDQLITRMEHFGVSGEERDLLARVKRAAAELRGEDAVSRSEELLHRIRRRLEELEGQEPRSALTLVAGGQR